MPGLVDEVFEVNGFEGISLGNVDKFQGGYRAVADVAARDALSLTPQRLEVGMLVRTVADNNIWELQSLDPEVWIEPSWLDAGSPAVTIREEGTPIAGAPHTFMNFVGPNITASNAGGGVADITVSGLPYRQVFADSAARLADPTVYAAPELYQKALQLDTMQEYVLTAIGPTTWTALGETVPESLKVLSVTTFPLIEPDDFASLSTITFSPAPEDLIIKRFEISSVFSRDPDPLAEGLFDQSGDLSFLENIRINGTPIDSSGNITPTVYTNFGVNQVEFNLRLSSGDVLTMDFRIRGIGSLSALYIPEPATLPPVSNFIGLPSGTFFALIPNNTTFATATLTIDSAPLTAENISFFNDILDNNATLFGNLGPRVSGSDNFDASLLNVNDLATEIAAAINDVANNISNMISGAVAVGNVVTLTARVSGPLGNTIRINNDFSGITETGFDGAILEPNAVVVMEAASPTLPAGSFIKYIETRTIGGEGNFDASIIVDSLIIGAGSNLLDSALYGGTTGTIFDNVNGELNIPISANDVVTLEVNGYISGLTVLIHLVIESPS